MMALFNLETHYRVKSIKGTQIEIGVTIKNKPSESREDLEMSIRGNGVVTVDTTKPIPLKSKMKMRMNLMGEEGDVTSELTSK